MNMLQHTHRGQTSGPGRPTCYRVTPAGPHGGAGFHRRFVTRRNGLEKCQISCKSFPTHSLLKSTAHVHIIQDHYICAMSSLPVMRTPPRSALHQVPCSLVHRQLLYNISVRHRVAARRRVRVQHRGLDGRLEVLEVVELRRVLEGEVVARRPPADSRVEVREERGGRQHAASTADEQATAAPTPCATPRRRSSPRRPT